MERQARRAYQAWIEGHVRLRCPELEGPILESIDAFDRINSAEQCGESDLRRIRKAVESSRSALWQTGVQLLAPLVENHTPAREALIELAKDHRSHVRFAALCVLQKQCVEKWVVELTRDSLADRSTKIRSKGAEVASQLGIKILIPDLETALAHTRSAEVRREIELNLALLRDGYRLHRIEDGSIELTIRHCGATSTGYFTESELKEKGVESLVRSLQVDLESLLNLS